MPKAPPVFHAFTQKYTNLALRIVTEVGVSQAYNPAQPPNPIPAIYKATALWDTGATNSVITSSLAAAVGLISIGTTRINHAGGISQSNTYLVNWVLPNNVQFYGVRVSECPDTDFGAIIGMDIISQGDFSLTNFNGQTCLSFRIPSRHQVDYVVEANKINTAGIGRNDPCYCGKIGSNGKPVKLKHCHGK